MNPPKRLQTQTERDLEGLAKRKEREAAVVDFIAEESSQAYSDPDERRRFRADKKPEDRIGRLEEKHDDLDEKVDAIYGDVREMRGELKVLPELVDLIKGKTSNEHETTRLAMTSRTKVILAIVALASTAVGAFVKWVAS